MYYSCTVVPEPTLIRRVLSLIPRRQEKGRTTQSRGNYLFAHVCVLLLLLVTLYKRRAYLRLQPKLFSFLYESQATDLERRAKKSYF